MPSPAGDPAPIPAATVALLRRERDGLAVLLTRRPASMAFAADLHVFPGGRVDPADADPGLASRSVRSPADAAALLGGDLDPAVALAAHLAAIRELFEEAGILLADGGASRQEIAIGRTALLRGKTTLAALAADLDLRVRTDRLMPLSRWVTPPGLSRRFDTRFFAAEVPPDQQPSFEGGEVADHRWIQPGAALEALADGRLPMWQPTTATLQQLEHVTDIAQIRERLAPGRLLEVVVEAVGPGVTRVVMPAGGGVAGQPVWAYLVGRRRFVLVDPGDPTPAAIDRTIEIATRQGGAIEAIALTQVDPDHAAGGAALAERLGVPIFVGPGGGRPLPYEVRELADGQPLPAGDVRLETIGTPGPRPEHLAFLVGERTWLLAGDLDGRRGARSIPGPPDPRAWAASRIRVARRAPGAAWLSGHPASEAG